MTKRLIAIAALLGTLSLGASAQERYMKVYSGGQVVYSSTTSGNNNIHFSGSDAVFSHNGDVWTRATGAIDSLVFSLTGEGEDTVAVDTGTAVRIAWNGNTATIANPFASRGVSVTADGGHVVVNSTLDSAYVPYILSGSSGDGSLTISTVAKVFIKLDGLSLTSTDGPALLVASDKKALIEIAGTNSLSDSDRNTGKGAFQSVGKVQLTGEGTLNVSGLAKHAIQTSGSFTIDGGHIAVLSAVKDGMNVDNFVMNGGTVSISGAAGDALDGDQGYIGIYGGRLIVNCTAAGAKGLNCDSTLTIGGGEVEVTVSGDGSKGLRTKGDFAMRSGSLTVHADGTVAMETAANGYDPSYCTGIKVGGNARITGGVLSVVCAATNAGGKAISSDGDIDIAGGTLTLTATGSCSTYTDSTGTTDSYSSTCIKANGNVTISGGTITATAGGRAISADGNYSQTGGSITASTSAAGFGTVRYSSGSSYYSDGFAAACLKVDGNISFSAGTFTGSSTGKAGRGIRGKGTLTFGTTGAADSLLHVYVTTSGAPFLSSSNSSYWRGLPKGVKIEGDITVNSGYLRSYCSQTSSGGGFGGGGDNGEGIETKSNLVVNGGYVEANSLDDAINAASYIQINGGHVWAYARGNDGMDCNGSRIDINGGTVICQGTEVAIDDNGDHGGKLYVTGGTIVLIGGNMGTTEATPSLTGQKSLKITGSSWGGGGGSTIASNGFCIKSGSTEVLTFKSPTVSGNGFAEGSTAPLYDGPKPPGGNSSGVWVTSPSIQSGTYTNYTSPGISGGSNWHGLYSGATVTTSGSGTSITAQ